MNNDSWQDAYRKIEEDQKCRRSFCCIGPTGRLFKSSNKIIINPS